MIETSLRVLAPDGETVAVEVVLQEGGAAAAVRATDEVWHTPDTLDQIAAACSLMAQRIRSGV